MKKIKIFKAFSLAEALVTLLIVCLITIASIPVITKKKRTVDKGPHGLWMCALNSNGNYAVFDSNNPKGTPNNPDSWNELAEATSCRFDPPINAKNISVTLIGGGGAGGTGISELEPILDSLHPTFRPTENSLYRLTMIGGGGGGAHGSNHHTNQGGSGGAAGAFFVGNIKLPAFYEYGHVLGTGGAKGQNIDYDQSSEPWAGSGGATKFYIKTSEGNKDFIIAHGGGGGQARTCKQKWTGDWKCGGGNPSTGGTVEYPTVTNFSYETTGASFTGQGMPGTNAKTATSNPTYTAGGAGTTILVNGVEQTYGAGGRGVYNSRSNTAEPGQVGYFSLDKFNLFGGLGGEAALPTEYTFPKINGFLRFIIGRGGTATAERSTAGQPTELEYVNIRDQVIARYYGAGGAAGLNNTNHVATVGANSYWTKTGGGTVGECSEGGNAGVTLASQIAYVETGKCETMLGTGGRRNTTDNTEVQKSYAVPGVEYPRPMNHLYGGTQNDRYPYSNCSPIASDVNSSRNTKTGAQYTTNKLSNSDQSIVLNGLGTILVFSQEVRNATYVHKYCGHLWYCSEAKAKETLQDLYCADGSDTSKECIAAKQDDAVKNLVCMFQMPPDDPIMNQFDNLISEITTETQHTTQEGVVAGIVDTIKSTTGATSNTHKYLTYWTENPSNNEHGFTYECLLPEYAKVEVPYGVYNVETPPTCSQSGSGTSFGAGGGGGAVNENFVGSAGIGGSGANGAVIIKW